MRKNRIRNDNRGLSLVELLVAVAILAILVSPLLGSFATSAQIARRGRLNADATNTAQNVAENLHAAGSIESIIGQINLGRLGSLAMSGAAFLSFDGAAYVAADEVTAEDGLYYIGLRGLTSSDGGGTFDAVIKLDAEPYEEINSRLVTQYSPMDTVFLQPSEEGENPDLNAADYFAAQVIGAIGDDSYNSERILGEGMDRVIDVIVMQEQDHDDVVITAMYSYTFTLDSETSFRYEEPAYEFRYPSEEGDSGGIYLFFFPNYARSAGSSSSDTINIYNNHAGSESPANGENLDFSVFLVKQLLPSASDPEIALWESIYNVSVNLWQNSGSQERNAGIYSNLGTRLDSGGVSLNTGYDVYTGRYWRDFLAFDGMLVRQAARDRLYQATIELYEGGAVGTGENPFTPDPDLLITTFDATKTS